MSERSFLQPDRRPRLLLALASLLAAATGAVALAAALRPSAFTPAAIDVTTTLLPFPIAFVLGLLARRWSGLTGIVWMAGCLEINQGYVNPFVLVLTCGPWYAGTMIRVRRRAARELAVLTQQLEDESERRAEQTVRLERARIAHELHDIVAHNVSVMVVQAYAGARLARSDQAAATEALGHIRAAAAQANDQIGQLVELLASPAPVDTARPLPAGLADLVTTAAATGIPVTLSAQAGLDELAPTVTAAAYRIVQEAITNSLKYAPGAPIDVRITRSRDVVTVVIANGPAAPGTPLPLSSSGGGHGIVGMTDRARELGGDVHAGREGRGWLVAARLPLGEKPRSNHRTDGVLGRDAMSGLPRPAAGKGAR